MSIASSQGILVNKIRSNALASSMRWRRKRVKTRTKKNSVCSLTLDQWSSRSQPRFLSSQEHLLMFSRKAYSVQAASSLRTSDLNRTSRCSHLSSCSSRLHPWTSTPYSQCSAKALTSGQEVHNPKWIHLALQRSFTARTNRWRWTTTNSPILAILLLRVLGSQVPALPI